MGLWWGMLGGRSAKSFASRSAKPYALRGAWLLWGMALASAHGWAQGDGPTRSPEAELERGAQAEERYQEALAVADLAARVPVLQACLELDPTHVEASFALADAYWQLGDKDNCLATLSRARQLAPNQETRPEWRKRAQEELDASAEEQTPDGVVRRLKTAVALAPELAPAWLKLADALWMTGDRVGAADALTKARKANGLADRQGGAIIPPEPWQSRATEEFYQAFTPILIERIRHLETCVALDPTRAKAWYNLGNAYYDNGQGQKAADAYKSALAVTPDYDKALWNYALALVSLDQPEQALDVLARHLALQKTPQDQRRSQDFADYVRHLESRRRPGVVYLMDGDLYTARSGDNAVPQTKLTEFGDVQRALLSPDRDIVAVVRRGNQLATWDLFAQRLREHQLPLAGPILDLAWSADSERVALIVGTGADPSSGDVLILDPRTEALKPVTTDGINARLAWAPDGTRLAYVKTAGPKAGLTVARLDDGAETQLAPAVEGVTMTGLAWSPDGHHLAYLQMRRDGLSSLTVVGADTPERYDTQAQVKGNQVVWSGSGRYIVYEAPPEVGLQGLYCWDVETNEGGEVGISRAPIVFAVAPTADADARGAIAAAPVPKDGETTIEDSVVYVAAFPGKYARRVLALSETSYGAQIVWDERGELIGMVVAHLDAERKGLYEIVTIKPVVDAPGPQFLALGLKPLQGPPQLLGLIPPALGPERPGGPVKEDEPTDRGVGNP